MSPPPSTSGRTRITDGTYVVDCKAIADHNGRTEGVNTHTKRIMRQMHGRAGFDLLRHRILLP
ncbi:hypothetical protein [Streptomyces sp. NPDC055692]|uniref:hypothetical protein n=1 Tax=Streptomyces sp. NPDC055692 TaxID=3155683 RepID=UPI00342D6920